MHPFSTLGTLVAVASGAAGMAQAAPPPVLQLLEQGRPLMTLPALTPDQREMVAKQAFTVLNEVWVNKYYKWENHNVHGPELMGRVVRQARELDDTTFQARMIDVFEQIVDLHTQYSLPKPYQCHSSLLPLAFDYVRDSQGTMRVVVSRLRSTPSRIVAETRYQADLAKIRRGDIVEMYDGLEINAALRKLAHIGQGANAPAQEAQAIAKMDFRWHTQKLVPERDDLSLKLKHADGSSDVVTVPWLLYSDAECLAEPETPNPVARHIPKPQLNLSVHASAMARLAALSRLGEPTFAAPQLTVVNHPVEPKLHYGLLQNGNGTFGYLRIDDFMPVKLQGEGEFIRAVGEILQAMRQTNGLVIDLRGNPGGNGSIAEGLVQLFTPRTVQDTNLRMLVSETNRKIMALPGWQTSVTAEAHAVGLARGLRMTDNFPFLPGEDLNGIGQYYFQPVALLVDPTCYSSCDVFSAHMQDHRAATVWGQNGWQTGAGGGNVIQYADFNRWFSASGVPDSENPFPLLPFGTTMSVGWRQIQRTGLHTGQPVEDAGVQADRVTFRNMSDFLNGNENELFEPITRKLAVDFGNRSGSAFHLTGSSAMDLLAGQDLQLPGIMVNTDKVRALLDGKPLAELTTSVQGMRDFTLQLPLSDKAIAYHRLDLFGMSGRDTTWHIVRTVRIRPASTTAGVSATFDRLPGGMGIYSSAPVPTSGWQISNGRLVSNTTPEYADNTTSIASLFVNLADRGAAALELDADIATEEGFDYFMIQAVTAEGETMLLDPVSGNLGRKHLRLDLTPFAGREVEIRFIFMSDGGVGGPGVALDNLTVQ